MDRHDWQRDVLRRFIVSGYLIDKNIQELPDICKATYGLNDGVAVCPLSELHIPTIDTSKQDVILNSLWHSTESVDTLVYKIA